MNSNDKTIQSVAEAVKQIMSGSKLSEDKKDYTPSLPHMMYDPKTGKGYEAKTREDHLKMKDMGYTHEKPSAKDEKALDDNGKNTEDLKALHAIKKTSPQFEEVESTQIAEDVDNFFGFSTKDGLVKFQSMAKKLRIKPISNPTVMKRGGKEFHVMGFEGSVRNIEKAMKAAIEVEKGTAESVDFTKEGNEFTAAAAKAKLAGTDEFEFDGKKYPVEMEQDAAEKILGKKESVELQEAANFGDIEKVMKWAKKNIVGGGKFPQLDISKKYGTAFINLTIMNVIVLRLGGKKGIVVTHDDRRSSSGKAYEEHFSNANDVIKFVEKLYNEMSKDESVADDATDAIDDNEKNLKKSLPNQVKETTYSEELISKILEKKTPVVENEEAYDSDEKHTMDPKSHVELNKETGMYCVYNIKGKKVAEFKTKEEAEEYAVKNHDALMKESVNEAIKPADFVKGGDGKATKADVDKIIGKIFINDSMLKKMEKSKPFQEGEKSKGKKKNPYKKDTIDFHHYELGVQSSQVSM